MSGFDSYRVRERADVARTILVGAFLVLAGAFFRTQIIQHDKFQLKAETNRLRPISLTPPRGAILDRRGRIIAENVPGYSVKLLAPSRDSLREVLGRVGHYVPFDTSETTEILRRYAVARYQPVVVFGDATFETVARLEEHRAVLPGLVIQSEPKRLYPAGKAVAHLVGYVSEVTESDLSANRFPGAGLGSIVGKAGLEREYDDTLRGAEGVRYIEVNARGRLVREDASTAALAPTPGHPILTTIDLDLQRYIDSVWPPGVRGAMVAMTPSGEIRALYSAPSYDPNAFVGGISNALWRALNDDEARPLLNRAIQTRYPPASPFKLAIAAMALKRGLIGLDTHMPAPCRGGLRLGNRVFRCWKKEGHGSLDLIGAVASSCDVYFYQLGLRLGLTAIVQDGVLMGFRDKSGIDLENEVDPDLSRHHRLLRPALRAPQLEPARDDAQLLDRPGREHPDAHQHDALLRGADRGRRRRRSVHRAARAVTAPRPGPHVRAARRAAPGADRRGGARHGLRQPTRRPRGRRQDRHRPEPARQGPRVVHRVRAGRQARAGRRRHHGVRRARHRRWRPTSSALSAATCSAPTPPARSRSRCCWTRRWRPGQRPQAGGARSRFGRRQARGRFGVRRAVDVP